MCGIEGVCRNREMSVRMRKERREEKICRASGGSASWRV